MDDKTYQTEEEKLAWEAVEKTFKMKLGGIIKGETYNRAANVLRGFGLELAWRVINIFLRATHLEAEDGKTKLRDPKEILRLVTEIMKRLEDHLENHNVYAERVMQPKRHGEMRM